MSPDEVLNDFKRKYNNTYVFVQEPCSSEQSLYLIESIEASNDRLAVLSLYSEEVGRIRLNMGSAHTIKFVPAPVGVFQYGPDAYYCLRRPQKQYRRGICSDNTIIEHTTSGITRMAASFNFELVAAAFEHKTYSIKEALEKLKTGKYRSVALANNFSISLSVTSDPDYFLFYMNMAVARISQGGEMVNLYAKALAAQIKVVLEN